MTDSKKSTTERHSDEIAAILRDSNERVAARQLQGRDLLRERQACSKAMVEACGRHRVELNAKEPTVEGNEGAAS